MQEFSVQSNSLWNVSRLLGPVPVVSGKIWDHRAGCQQPERLELSTGREPRLSVPCHMVNQHPQNPAWTPKLPEHGLNELYVEGTSLLKEPH